MWEGISMGAAALGQLSRLLDVVSVNLANASTVGFKADGLAFNVPNGNPATGVSYVDPRPGPLSATGNPFDVALNSDGFFVIRQNGTEFYTRDGRFSMNAQGNLTTLEGWPVLGLKGPIRLDPKKEFKVSAQGDISQNGVVVDRFKTVKVANSLDLRKEGAGLFSATSSPVPAPVNMVQGFQEDSNVRSIEEMSAMIKTLRQFESVQKSVSMQDQSTRSLMASLGKFS